MTKSLMISIQPHHAFNIMYGKKTLELRTWIPKDYVGWVYVYVTKGKFINGLRRIQDIVVNNKLELLNGKVGFRFWFDEYDDIIYKENEYIWCNGKTLSNELIGSFYLSKLKLSYEHIFNYGKGKDLYAWHIKKLEIFDEPKELSKFYQFKKKWVHSGMDCPPYVDEVKTILIKAPQKSVWVYTKEK